MRKLLVLASIFSLSAHANPYLETKATQGSVQNLVGYKIDTIGFGLGLEVPSAPERGFTVAPQVTKFIDITEKLTSGISFAVSYDTEKSVAGLQAGIDLRVKATELLGISVGAQEALRFEKSAKLEVNPTLGLTFQL